MLAALWLSAFANYHFCQGTCGTIYSLSIGLGPLVKSEPGLGSVGAAVNMGPN
jgi:hypothetical protein